MCGISGIISFGKALQYIDTVSKMNDSLAHRGPNGHGIWNDANAVLGHRRLAIIDLSDGGLQPMFSADKRYVLVYNGEIYNYRELKQELSGYNYTNNSDSEVILAAYSRWGTGCVNHFNGMFAFAIFDTVEKELFMARDRMGIKPLYFYSANNLMVFSSEIRTMLTSDLIPRKLDHASLTDYLRYQTVNAPSTIIKDVKMLMPGEWLKVSQTGNILANSPKEYTEPEILGEMTVQPGRYWQMNTRTTARSPEGKTLKEIHFDILELLNKAVEKRLVSDVPFGAFLSGGIDSSAIVGIMSQVLNRPVNTFSVIFNERNYSESDYSQLIAKRFATTHNEIHLTPEDFMRMLPEALSHMDHPSGDGPNTWVVSKMTREAGITMALSGLGGDELFAGYKIFKRLFYMGKSPWIGDLPPQIKNIVAGMVNLAPTSVPLEKLKAIITSSDWQLQNTYSITRSTIPDNHIFPLLREHLSVDNSVKNIVAGLSQYDAKHLLSYISRAELSTYLQNTLLRDTDQMSMAHGLEVRVPFLDHELVEYVLQVEDSYKFPHSPKQLLIESLGSLLPKEIVSRRKMGFAFPWDTWMRNELRSYCEQNIKVLGTYEIINNDYLQKLWHRFLKNDPLIPWSRIWPMVVLGNWMKENGVETSLI